MIEPKKVYLALDTAYHQGAVVLVSEDGLLCQTLLTEKLFHGKLLCQTLKQALSYCSQQGYSLAGVFCGLGPGSFVGIRVALATCLGFTYARNIPLMGFCSHRALGLSLKPSPEKFSLFMKASGELGYLTRFEQSHDGLMMRNPPQVVAMDHLKGQQEIMIFSDQAERLREVVGPHSEVKELLGPSTWGLRRAASECSHGFQVIIDQSSTIKPNYVKSPNVSVKVFPSCIPNDPVG